MFDIHHSKLDLNYDNEVIDKVINLDVWFDAFILIDSEDKKIATIALNSILDALIWQVDTQDTYKQFSAALESINQIFKTWQNDGEKIQWLNIFIWVLQRKNLIFSTLWRMSGYLIKRDGDITEILDAGDAGKKEFNFISNGDINEGEVVIIGSNAFFDELSKSDLRESAVMDSSENMIHNIETILTWENLTKNIWFFALKNDYFAPPKESTSASLYWEKVKHTSMKCLDNKPIKKLVAMCMIWKDKLSEQSQIIKAGGFLVWICITCFLLYSIISGILSTSTTTREVTNSKQALIQAREYIKLANENLANPDIFALNMKKAEDLVYEIQDKQLFLNDISKILDDITIIKKQFNGVESFEENAERMVLKNGKWSFPIKVLENRGKTYIITKNSVIGPIIPNNVPKETIFSQLDSSDAFKNAVVVGDNIILLTQLAKIVNFSKSGFFQYIDTLGQKTWQESSDIDSFLTNIYLLNKEQNQITKHKKVGDNYDTGTPFLKLDDSKNIGKILSIGVDGGMYILKNDLSILKVFSSPKYRVESILINKLPKNYIIEGTPENIKIKTRGDLAYVYILLNNKIWIFQPNTKLFQDTKSLMYVGQIEGKQSKIRDFYVSHDGLILTLTETWLYTLKFEISNNKVIIR
jgi:hypothetical protein